MKTAFPPVVTAASRVLVLGSMPGEASLQQQEYYAHPRNAFWWIMQQLLGLPQDLAYSQRIVALSECGLALWDVLHRCEREGSLDSAIQQDSAEANDFEAFLTQYPQLELICFNGRSVAQLFQRHVVRGQQFHSPIARLTLPSTSPANARVRPEEKLAEWRVLSAYIRPYSA